MKTKTFILVFSLSIMFMILASSFILPKSDPEKIQSLGNNPKFITYVVNIEHYNLAGFNCNYYIVIIDDKGNPVTQPQSFKIGAWSYTFFESAEVSGTRTAVMLRGQHEICEGSYNFRPCTLQGPFISGRTYKFMIEPVMWIEPASEQR